MEFNYHTLTGNTDLKHVAVNAIIIGFTIITQ